MFAVVRTGGKQYRVAPGDKIVVEKMDGSAGDRITLGDVLLAGDGSDLRSTDGLTVAAEIIAQAKGEKVTVFKKRRRHNYRRKKGHRQQHTILKIVAIGDQKQDAAPAKAAKKSKPAPEAEAAGGAVVSEQPTASPAPDSAQASSGAPAATEAAAAPAKPKKAKPAAETASTGDAAPAKGGSKKAPKAK
jgi:large subunit ribosomal protein L21